MARNNCCCSVCGEIGHLSRNGRCSRAHLARRAVLSGMSQVEAARTLGVSEATVSDAMQRMRRLAGVALTASHIEEHW